MPEALAVVNVGNSAWLLRRSTPSRAIAAMVGAVLSSTRRERRPSAMKSTTLCGCPAGVCAKAAQPSINCSNAAARESVGRIGKLRPGRGEIGGVLNGGYDTCVTGVGTAPSHPTCGPTTDLNAHLTAFNK